jgi:hypothetical protein
LANLSSGLTINVRTLAVAALAVGGLGIVRDLLQAGVARKKISACEAPHTGRAGDLRGYDRLQHHYQEVIMGSGAYSVFIDQQAGGGPAGALRRVVPLPPPELSGGVKFTTVVLSLAYDNFGDAGAPATIPATVRILRGSGPIQTLNVNIEVGRKFFHFMHADDQAASVQLNPPAGFRPQVSAMVEYTTP